MCESNEHMMIGDTAAAWIPQMLAALAGAKGNLADYQQALETTHREKIFDPDGWFTNFKSGQFRYGTKRSPDTGAEIEYASYGDILALSGDYFDSENELAENVGSVDELLQEYHRKLKTPNRVVLDPSYSKMVSRAKVNWPHFGFEAVDLWSKTHQRAIEIAIASRKEGAYDSGDVAVKDKKWSPVVCGLLLALRHNALADHYLSDLFSSAHMRVPRLAVHTFLNRGFCAPSASKWQLGPADAPSLLARIAHQEDGHMGLWCSPAFGECSLPGLEGASGAISGFYPDPDTDNDWMPVVWEAPFTGAVSNFFALGDDHLFHPENQMSRRLCYYCIGLSIRDILIASVTGEDPRLSPGYWDAVGGQPSPAPTYAPLRLVPRPLKAESSWTPVASNRERVANHPSFLKPNYGMEAYFDNLKSQMSGDSFERPESFEFRSVPFMSVFIVPGIGTLPVMTIPGPRSIGCDYDITTGDYFDLRHALEEGDEVFNPEMWRLQEYRRLGLKAARYDGGGLADMAGEFARRVAVAIVEEQLKEKKDQAIAMRDFGEFLEKEAEKKAGEAKDAIVKKAQEMKDRAVRIREKAKTTAGKAKDLLLKKADELEAKAKEVEQLAEKKAEEAKAAVLKKAQEVRDRAGQVVQEGKDQVEGTLKTLRAKKDEFEQAASNEAGAIKGWIEHKARKLDADIADFDQKFTDFYLDTQGVPR